MATDTMGANCTAKKGRESTRVKKTVFLEAFEATGSIVRACERMEIARRTYYNWLKDPDFSSRVNEIRESLIDLAESGLMELVKGGNVTAIIFMLKCLGKSRGYVERQEVVDIKAFEEMSVTVARAVKEALEKYIPDEGLRKEILKDAGDKIKALIGEYST